MKFVAQYVAEAVKFEQLAASENDPDFKAQLEQQAAAYRKLAAERAKKLGLSPPDKPR